MTIQQCKYVLAIAETGSFNEAAKKLFVAQSSISGSIKSLEKELGIQIFQRLNTGVFLTPDGAEFVRYASQIVQQSDFVTDRYRNPLKNNRLTVVTQHYDFVAHIFGKMVSESDDSSYNFSLRETKTYNVIQEIENALCDVGIIAIKDSDDDLMKRYLKKKGLSFTSFCKASPHVYIRKGHILAKKDTISLNDLKDFPYASYEQGEHNNSFFTEEIVSEVSSNKHIEFSDRASLLNVLIETNCYTVGTGIMPSNLCGDNIVTVPLESSAFYTIGYIIREDRKPTEFAQRFINYLQYEFNINGADYI